MSLGGAAEAAHAQSVDAGAPLPEVADAAVGAAADGGEDAAVVIAPEPAPVVVPEETPSAAPAADAETLSAAPAADAETNPDMLVTAQRYVQDVQKTPVAVTAFGARAMEARGVTNLQDVSKFTPNLELHATNRPAGGSSAYAAYIRGIGTGDFQFPTDPGVGLYVDDVYVARTVGGLLSTDADLVRIEVIQGPQGTLFGRNTIGGAFNIATAKPALSGPATGSALLRVGNYGRRDYSVSVNAPVVDGVMGAKLSLSGLHSDGYGERVLTGQKTNDEERFTARGGLLFQLGKNLDLRIDADYSRQDQTPPNGALLRFVPAGPVVDKIGKYNEFAAPALNPGLGLANGAIYDQRWVSPGRFDNYALQPAFDRYDIGGASAKLTYAPSDAFSFKSISAVRTLASDIAVDGDQTPYPLQSSHTKLKDTQYSEELQIGGRLLDQRLNYLVGLYAFRETGNSSVDTQSFHGLFENAAMPVPADAADTLARFKLTATSYAVFTQETFELLPGLHVTAGARLNRDEKDYQYSSDFPERGAAQVPLSRAKASWNSFTPKLGVDWSFIEPAMVYASYSQGFKSGGFGPSNNAMIPTPKYNPERVTAYELGLKTHWFPGRKLTTNIAAFYNDYRDIQLTVQSRDAVTGGNVRTTQNAGASHIKGFEANAVALPVKGLALNAGVGYVDAKFNTLSADALMSGFKLGDRLPQIPDWSFNAGAQYTYSAAWGELTLRGDVSFKGSQFLTAVDPSSYQASYALYSARLSFVPAALDALEVSVYAVNLTDKTYYVYHATLAPTGEEVAIAGQPRLIFATAKYMF